MCRSKHVEQLRNSGIINSTTRSHLVDYFYTICVTMHWSMNIKCKIEVFSYLKEKTALGKPRMCSSNWRAVKVLRFWSRCSWGLCDAASSGNLLQKFRGKLAPPSSRVDLDRLQRRGPHELLWWRWSLFDSSKPLTSRDAIKSERIESSASTLLEPQTSHILYSKPGQHIWYSGWATGWEVQGSNSGRGNIFDIVAGLRAGRSRVRIPVGKTYLI